MPNATAIFVNDAQCYPPCRAAVIEREQPVTVGATRQAEEAHLAHIGPAAAPPGAGGRVGDFDGEIPVVDPQAGTVEVALHGLAHIDGAGTAAVGVLDDDRATTGDHGAGEVDDSSVGQG